MSTDPVVAETMSNSDAEALRSSAAESDNRNKDLTPDLIDYDIQQVLARRGKDKTRMYKVMYNDLGREDTWVLPHVVSQDLIHKYFVQEEENIALKKEFLRKAREIQVKMPKTHKYNTRSAAGVASSTPGQ